MNSWSDNMDRLLAEVNQTNLEILCILVAIVAILLAVIVIADFIISKVKYNSRRVIIEEVKKVEPIEDERLSKTVPIKEIKYVDDNEEIERAKAQMELQNLKQELMAKEKKILEEQAEIKRKAEELKVVPITVPVQVEQEVIPPVIPTIEEPIVVAPVETKEQIVTAETTFNDQYIEEEMSAIISIDELKVASQHAYSDEEMAKYDDEGNEPISLKEVEMLANTMKMKPIELREFELPDETPVKEEKTFERTPYISPIFGNIQKIENRITVENPNNYDKLNEEIRKTNEFLATIKELRKNLD